MSIEGFDPRWTDFPDYILGITHEIWEETRVDTLHHYYAPDIPVRSPSSLVIGNEAVMTATRATLKEFPDRVLLGEDVIWSQDETGHYLSSHRICSRATHANDGVYGKATGKTLSYYVIADCAARNNTIDDEWLIRDQGAIVRQLGIEPSTYARDLIRNEGGDDQCVKPFSPQIDVAGPYKGRGNDNVWGDRLIGAMEAAFTGQEDEVHRLYDRASYHLYPGGIVAHGRPGALDFWTGLRKAFPGARLDILHQIGREDPMMPPRAAVRWSIHGLHEGDGLFGPATQAEIYVMGLTHAEFGPFGPDGWSLRREWSLFDETAIWKQIHLHTGEF